MLNIRTCALLVACAVLTTYLVEQAGFAIAHSVPLFLLAAFLSPGLFSAFFKIVPSGWPTILLACAITTAYYFCIALWLHNRRAKKVAGSK